MSPRLPLPALLAALAMASACLGAGPEETAAAYGERLAASPRLSSAASNEVACTTCHAVSSDDPRILPGYSLVGAAKRPSFWGGYEPELLGAVDACLLFFMKSQPLDPDDPAARALYEYLLLLGGDVEQEALPLTIQTTVKRAPPPGDPLRGAEVHRLGCESCHGAAGTGAGRIMIDAPILPDQSVDEALELFPDDLPATVFTEKVRHGQFFSVGGTMPLFSAETLSDEDLGALLSFYGLQP